MTRALLQQALDALTTRDVRLHELAAEALRAELAKPAQPTAKSVYEAIEHGDDQHRAWLRDALTAIWAGQPVPELQPPAQPAQEPVQFLANGTRFKTSEFPYGVCINGLPKELSGRWVALVAAEDNCHLKISVQTAQEPTTAVSLQCAHCQITIEQRNDKVMSLMKQFEQEPRPPNCGTGHCSCIECHDPAYRAMVRGIGGKA